MIKILLTWQSKVMLAAPLFTLGKILVILPNGWKSFVSSSLLFESSGMPWIIIVRRSEMSVDDVRFSCFCSGDGWSCLVTLSCFASHSGSSWTDSLLTDWDSVASWGATCFVSSYSFPLLAKTDSWAGGACNLFASLFVKRYWDRVSEAEENNWFEVVGWAKENAGLDELNEGVVVVVWGLMFIPKRVVGAAFTFWNGLLRKGPFCCWVWGELTKLNENSRVGGEANGLLFEGGGLLPPLPNPVGLFCIFEKDDIQDQPRKILKLNSWWWTASDI